MIAPPIADNSSIASEISRAWWLILLRGLATLLFGILCFVWPGTSLLALVLVYGFYAIADGVFSLIGAVRGGGVIPRWWLALAGLTSLGAGAVALLWPSLTLMVMVLLIGIWAVVRGVLEIIGAITLRKVIRNEWLLALAGVLSILVGLAMVIMPGLGALVVLWMTGAWAILFGLIFIILALRLRTLRP